MGLLHRTIDPVSRRKILFGGAGLLASASLPGCDLLSTDPVEDAGSGGSGSTNNQMEAPALAQRVKAGDLPAVEERLPRNPAVVEPVEGPGQYGGTWHAGILGTDQHYLDLTISYEGLLRWNPEWSEVEPNVAESFEIHDDGHEFTFVLREGMKWSDGEPLTADDIMFWYEAVFRNDQLTPTAPIHLETDGEPVEVEKVDDYTVRFVFSKPNGLFIPWMAGIQQIDMHPQHYLSKFHPDYTDNVDELAQEQGYDDWVALFGAKNDYWSNPERPRLHAWLPTAPFAEGTGFTVERNPYYFKVDSDGRQLPYLDSVDFRRFNDEESMVLAASNGDLELQDHYINLPSQKPVLARGRETGQYEFQDLKSSWMNWAVLTLNLNHKDPALREAFQNKDFRIGLSHAINRQEIADVVFQQQGRPWQAAPRPETPFSDEELGTRYAEFDPDLANEYLDRAGYSQRDDQGRRLLSNGQPISFVMMAMQRFVHFPPLLELVSQYFQNVGVEMRPEILQSSLVTNRYIANNHDAMADVGQYGYTDGELDPRWYFPYSYWGAFYAPLWYRWLLDDEGEKAEPPEPMKEQLRIYNERVVPEIDKEKRVVAMREIVEIAIDELWVFGTVLPINNYGVVANNFGNVPESGWDGYMCPTPAVRHPEQFFINGT